MSKLQLLWRAFHRDESGQVLVLFALSFVVICGMAGLAIDVGFWENQRATLQGAVDAAALAGAATLRQGAANASNNANSIANTNASSGKFGRTYTFSFPTTGTVEVDATEQSPTFFTQIFGIHSMKINVTAQAQDKGISSMTGLSPIGIPVQDTPFVYGQSYPLTDGPGNGNSGNYNFLDFYAIDPNPPSGVQGNGASELNWYLQNPSTFSLSTVPPSNTVPTKPGLNVGQVSTAIDTLVSEDPNATFATVAEHSPRLLYVPVVNINGSGRTDATIVGFACFFLEGYDKKNKQINGEFVQMITAGAGGNSTQDYGAETSVLIK